MRFYTTERLSANRSLTPEGYLLCENVPLARTGVMTYGPGETPIKPKSGSKIVLIHRRPEEVFAPSTLASYQGKPFTDDHPEDDVTPDTWAKLAKGIILNPRRGTGDDDDCVLGDILVTDPETIKGIRDNEKVEVSVGYDADYQEIGPGEGYQNNIIVNHTAWVVDGRCGPRCSIGDSLPKPGKGKRMSRFTDALMQAFKAKTADEVAALANELDPEAGGGGEHHVHVHLPGGGAAPKAESNDEFPPKEGAGAGTPPPAAAGAGAGGDVGTRLSALEAAVKQILVLVQGAGAGAGSGAGDPGEGEDRARDGETEEERKKREETKDDETIEGKLAMEAPPGTDDKARKAKDSAYLGDAYQVLVSQIEIITPGARYPTFDTAARPAVTYSKMCGMRTETLLQASKRPELASVIEGLNGGRAPDYKRMTCDAAKIMLASVASHAGALNNKGEGSGAAVHGFGRDAALRGTLGGGGVRGKITSPADLNKMAKELYKVT
jgi:hypothetical protein